MAHHSVGRSALAVRWSGWCAHAHATHRGPAMAKAETATAAAAAVTAVVVAVVVVVALGGGQSIIGHIGPRVIGRRVVEAS